MTDRTDLSTGLAEILEKDLIETDADVTSRYAVDRALPKAVVYPTKAEQIAEVVRFANQEKLTIIPWGSGTKMAMGNSPDRLDLVVSTARLNRLKDVDAANLTITVESGVKFRDIQARVATEEDRCYLPLGDLDLEEDEMICSERSHSGCFLPLDPTFSDKATIGGIIASNSTGPRRLLYGLPRDVVLGVRFVASDGKIVGAGGKTVKNVSGYDISKLMIGSMGTLGILCDMTLRLLPLPERMETLLLSFGSLSDASTFADRIFETNLLPAAVEVTNENTLKNLGVESTLEFGKGDYIVAVALEAFEEAVNRMAIEMRDLAVGFGSKTDAAVEEDEHLRFWLKVSDLGQTLQGQSSSLISAQLNCPISNWNALTQFADETLLASGIQHTLLAHAGSGVCLVNLLPEMDDATGGKRAAGVVDKLFKNCLDVGGNLITLKAPSDLKGDLPLWGQPGQDTLIMRRLKESLDPSGVMSPGRFVGNI